MKRISILILLLYGNAACSAENKLTIGIDSAPEVKTVDILIRDPNIQLYDYKIDEDFFRKDRTIQYHSAQKNFVSKVAALMPNSERDAPVSLPKKYLYQPIAIFIFSDGKKFLYDGCYVQPTGEKNYYKAAKATDQITSALLFADDAKTKFDCEDI